MAINFNDKLQKELNKILKKYQNKDFKSFKKTTLGIGKAVKIIGKTIRQEGVTERRLPTATEFSLSKRVIENRRIRKNLRNRLFRARLKFSKQEKTILEQTKLGTRGARLINVPTIRELGARGVSELGIRQRIEELRGLTSGEAIDAAIISEWDRIMACTSQYQPNRHRRYMEAFNANPTIETMRNFIQSSSYGPCGPEFSSPKEGEDIL